MRRTAAIQDGSVLERANWVLCALVGTALLTWVVLTDFTIDLLSGLGPFGGILGLSVLILFYTRYRPDPRIASTLTALVQLIAFTGLGAPLSYCMASLAHPLWDATLHRWDLSLGLDWRAALDWLDTHPSIGRLLSVTYGSILPQMIVATAVLGLTGRLQELRIFVAAVIVSGIAAILISGAMPAMAYFVHLGLTPADYPNLHPGASFVHKAAMDGLRDGSLRLLFLNDGEGIITFPSYHAALAIIFARAFWCVRQLRWVGLVLNVLMILATPIDGGHYFVDVLAGIVIAVLALAAARRATALSWPRLPASPPPVTASLQRS